MQLEGRSTVQCDGFLVYIDYDTKILPVLSCSCPFAVDVGYADRQGSLERVHKREYKLEYYMYPPHLLVVVKPLAFS